jgi:nucleotide-binding universal stress UspA family protein
VFRRILVATDGSPTATTAVDRAVEVSRTQGAELTVLSCGSDGEAQQVVDAEVGRLAASGVAAHGLVVDGDVASAIVQAARDGDFDLVVVGNKGMTGPRRSFTLGSVPNKVSHSLASSLLIVRTT